MVNGFEHGNQIADLHVVIIADIIPIDLGCQRLGIESAAAARRTQTFFDKLHGFLAHAFAQLGNVSVQIQPVKSRDNALIRQLGDLSGIVANEIHNQRLIRSDAKRFPLLFGKILELFVCTVQRIEFIIKLLPAAAGKLTEPNRTFIDGLVHVKQLALVQHYFFAETSAFRTHAMRMIQRIRHGAAGTRLTHTGKQQPNERCDIHRRSNRRTNIRAKRLLIDNNCRCQIVHRIRFRLFVSRQTLTQKHGIGRLPLSIALRSNGVKRQRAFSRSGNTCKNNQLLFWNRHVDMF